MRMTKICMCIAILFLTGSVLLAQTNKREDTADQFIPDFSSDSDMKELRVKEEPLSFEYGGWITSAIIDEVSGNEFGEQELLSLITISKLWMKANFTGNMSLYVRGKDTDFRVLDDSNIADRCGNPIENSNLLTLDMAFLSWSSERNALQLNLGRNFFSIGTGLILSDRGDGGEICFYNKIADLQLFGALTDYLDKDTNPYRLNEKDFQDGAKRTFLGGTISKKIYNQKLYLLALNQVDNSDTEYTYDSTYYGIGLQGTAGNAFYFGEYIRESGENNLSGGEKKDIAANAAVAGVHYYFENRFNPVILFNYAYGTGDKNNLDGDDSGFISFGKYEGGFALRPLLSNIHILRAGFSISPGAASGSKSLNRINILAKYSYYKKNNKNGGINYDGINYSEATNPSTDIGNAIDLALRWKVYYDFAVFANYGIFMPGDAYSSDEKNRTFLFAGVHLSI